MTTRFRRLAVIALATMTACTPVPMDGPPTRAVTFASTLPPMQQFAAPLVQPPSRSNAEIAQDFLDLSFQMESGRAIPVMTRFDGPVSVRVTGAVPPSLVPDLRALLTRLNTEARIDIFITGAPDANITIEAIPRAELQRAVPRAACFVVPRVGSWEEFKEARRTPQLDWTTLTRRDRATVFVPADVAPQEIRDCLHEELAQALGPLNDLYRLPDSVFNDDNIHAVLTGFDMLILRVYYSPELRNGMTRGQVAVRLPAILARLNPAGENRARAPINDTPRDWISYMETAIAGGSSPSRRRASAETAVNLTRSYGWQGVRRGYAHFIYGRLNVHHDSAMALAAFTEAGRVYAASPQTRLHWAHVAEQLAAYSLRAGDAGNTLALTEEAIPIAAAHQNAALLASLMMFQAEALELLDRRIEAQAVRLDSLGWARYGFGSEQQVRARLREIAALNPGNRG